MSDEPIFVSVQSEDFNMAQQQVALLDYAAAHAQAAPLGAIATFIGLVRAESAGPLAADSKQLLCGSLQALEIEHYPAMTAASIRKICEQAFGKWQLITCRVIHRVGTIPLGEQIVLVMVAAAHRAEAFAACEFIMDYLKTSAPIWKKAQFERGAQWVEARASDEQKTAHWQVR